MEQRDESTMDKYSGNKSPSSSQSPLETPTSAINNEPEIVKHQGLPDSETSGTNHSGNPILVPETQSSSPSNHQNPDPSSPSPPPPPAVPGENGVSNPKSTSSLRSPSNSSDDDFPISSMPDPGPAIQNPPVQVMKRAEEPDTPSAYRIPSHVFETNTNAPEWSVASNESLFSIHMGNMSFSRELSWLNSEKNMSSPLPPLACDTSNNGGITGNQSQENKLNDTSPSNQSQVNNKLNEVSTSDQSQVNKFNDISRNAGAYDEMTEAKAAETMRQVIMENSEDYGLSCVSVASRADGSHHNFHEQSRHSDGSTKSFAFSVRPEGDKSQRSSKGIQVQEKPKQQTQSEAETRKESSNSKPPPSQPPKATSNAPFKWLCCFTCCIKQ